VSNPVSLDARLLPIIAELVDAGVPLRLARLEFERKYMATAVRRCGSITQAAKWIGMHRNSLMLKEPSERAIRRRERAAHRKTQVRSRRLR
jgi:hypothetical protein